MFDYFFEILKKRKKSSNVVNLNNFPRVIKLISSKNRLQIQMVKIPEPYS